MAKLESFKISSTQRPGVGGGDRPVTNASKKAQEQQSEEASLGFARLEGMLEDEEESTNVSASLADLHDRLETFQEEAASNKDKASAKRALIAVERTSDLVDYLFATKEDLIENA